MFEESLAYKALPVTLTQTPSLSLPLSLNSFLFFSPVEAVGCYLVFFITFNAFENKVKPAMPCTYGFQMNCSSIFYSFFSQSRE
jgi:hypothetical protein